MSSDQVIETMAFHIGFQGFSVTIVLRVVLSSSCILNPVRWMQCYEGTEMVGKQNGRILITIIICIASWSVSIYRLYSVVMFVGAKALFFISLWLTSTHSGATLCICLRYIRKGKRIQILFGCVLRELVIISDLGGNQSKLSLLV